MQMKVAQNAIEYRWLGDDGDDLHLAAADQQIQPGTVIVSDEYFDFPNWQQHEHKAFMEWVERHQATYEYIGYTFQKTATYKSGHQLAVKIVGCQ